MVMQHDEIVRQLRDAGARVETIAEHVGISVPRVRAALARTSRVVVPVEPAPVPVVEEEVRPVYGPQPRPGNPCPVVTASGWRYKFGDAKGPGPDISKLVEKRGPGGITIWVKP